MGLRFWSSILLTFLLVLSVGCQGSVDGDGGEDAGQVGSGAEIFVWAGAADEGDGTRERPFRSLAGAVLASSEGDSIFLLSVGEPPPLDGGVVLKARQRLIGLGADGEQPGPESKRVPMVNSTDELEGAIVVLAGSNEVAGIEFLGLSGHAIVNGPSDYSGAYLHHNVFSGATESDDTEEADVAEEIVWSIRLEADSGERAGIVVADSEFREGASHGGIQVIHAGTSSGEYRFERNHFSDLGGRAYHVWSQGTSRVQSTIVDSTVDNIGLGEKNSDSILPHLRNSSQQEMTVSGFRYRNTGQVGNPSNCGLEAFIEGAPFQDESAWCDGCKLTLRIENSVFEDPVTDGIQLINFGSNSELDVEIRDTRVLRPKPQQVGGGISLLAQNEHNHGSRSRLFLERVDIEGSTRYGVAISDQGEGYTSIVDLGGGELGSAGENRIVSSVEGEVQVINAVVVAGNNWWGEAAPRITTEGGDARVETDPVLSSDPRSE